MFIKLFFNEEQGSIAQRGDSCIPTPMRLCSSLLRISMPEDTDNMKESISISWNINDYAGKKQKLLLDFSPLIAIKSCLFENVCFMEVIIVHLHFWKGWCRYIIHVFSSGVIVWNLPFSNVASLLSEHN